MTPCRILIVDDYAPAAKAIAELLKLGGHPVATAGEASAVVRAALAFQPDLILLDLALQERADGFVVAGALRREPTLTETLVVGLSGRLLPRDHPSLVSGTLDGFLEKPLQMELLTPIIQQAEQRAALGRKGNGPSG